MAFTDRIADTLGIVATMRRAGVIAPMRPDKYIRIAAAMQRENMGITSGFAAAAQRCPDRPGLVDELGTLTFREIDERADALAAGLQELGQPAKVIGVMARNHRGFVEALIAANRIGADVLLLNTSFAGPALAEVVAARRRRCRHLRRGVHRHRRPRTGRQAGRDADRRMDRRTAGWPDRRNDDRQNAGQATAAGWRQGAQKK